MKYKKLWTDMHSNIHHDQMEALPLWYEEIKKEHLAMTAAETEKEKG